MNSKQNLNSGVTVAYPWGGWTLEVVAPGQLSCCDPIPGGSAKADGVADKAVPNTRRAEASEMLRVAPCRVLVTLLLLFLAALAAPAATYTWTGAGFNGDTDYKWSNPLNWLELAAPQPGETGVALVFPNTAAPRNTTNDVLNLGISSISFLGSDYGIHGGSNGITMTLAGTNGTAFVLLGSGNNAQFGNSTRLHVGTTGTIAVAASSTLTIKSRISGVPGFVKSSPGTLSLQATQANTFFGTVTVQDGILELRGDAVSVPGALVIGNGDMNYTPIARLNADEQIGDTAPVTVNANGKLWLNAHNDTIGSLTIGSGAVSTGLGGGGALPGLLALNGNVTNLLAVPEDAGLIAGRLSLGSTTRGFVVDAGSELIVSAPISGITAGLVKAGQGQLTLTGSANNYGGATTVQAGTLKLSGFAKPGSTDLGTVVAQGARVLLENTDIDDESLALNGTTNGAAIIFTGTNTWSGPVTLEGDCAFQSLTPPNQASSLLVLSGVISGTGTFRKTGDGAMQLTGDGANTFGGGSIIEEGDLLLAKGSGIISIPGSLVVGSTNNGGTLAHVRLGNNAQIANSAHVSILPWSLLDAMNYTDSFGFLELTTGYLDCSGPSGLWTISGGVTNHLGVGPWGGVIGGRVQLGGSLRPFHCDPSSWLLVSGTLIGSGAGGVIKTGAGALAFYAANTYPGLTIVERGDLILTQDGIPGSTAAGTEVGPEGRLGLENAIVIGEALTLDGNGTNAWSLRSVRTNVWQGPLTLVGNPNVRGAYTNALLTLDGPIAGGNSGLSFDGPGTTVLTGNADNIYAGDTALLEGTLVLKKIGTAAVPGNLVIGAPTSFAPAALVRCDKPYQFAISLDSPTAHLTVNPSGKLDCGGFDQTIANLDLRDGWVQASGGKVLLLRHLTVEPVVGGHSYLLGPLTLLYGDSGMHTFDVRSNAACWLIADIDDAPFEQHLTKLGTGTLLMSGSNSFSGSFTIANGTVIAGGAQPFGTTDNVTIVQNGATLAPLGMTNAESFHLSGSGYTNAGALLIAYTNEFTGSINLTAATTIHTRSNGLAILSGSIGGQGSCIKEGEGKLVFAGASDNTFTSATLVNQGTLELAKTGATAIRGALEIGDGAVVRYLHPDQIDDLAPVAISGSGQFRLLGHSDAIGSLSGTGIVELLGATLSTGNNGVSTVYDGLISGLGGTLEKVGPGTLTLTADNAYTGPTSIQGGTLMVRGQQPQSAVQILTGGALAGTGTVGAISDLNGHVKPGADSYGILKCSGVATHAPNNLFKFAINGTVPGVDCDQLDVEGDVQILGGSLQLTMNFSGSLSNEYILVRNDGADPVTGSFVGLPEDALMTNNGVVLQITYQGGDGNDIALLQLSSGAPSVTGMQKLGDGSFQINGAGYPSAVYNIEATGDLTPPADWRRIGTVTADGAGQISFTDTDAPNFPMRFYRFTLP